jgi:hypothetical protein
LSEVHRKLIIHDLGDFHMDMEWQANKQSIQL